MPLVASCAQSPVTTTEVDYRLPPASLTQVEPVPDYTGRTFEDVIDYSLRLKSVIKKQNRDKKALQEWAKGIGNE